GRRGQGLHVAVGNDRLRSGSAPRSPAAQSHRRHRCRPHDQVDAAAPGTDRPQRRRLDLSAPRGSIRRKLVTAMMLTSTTVVILTGAALIIYDTISSRQSLTRRLTTQAEILAANLTAALAFENTDDARQLLAGLKSDPSTVMA